MNIKSTFMKLKSKSSQLERNFIAGLTDIETKIDLIWKKAKDIIHRFERFLHAVSSRYNNILERIKTQSRATRNKIIMIFKNEIKKIVAETMETMEKFRIIQEIQNFYSDMKDWLKYSEIIENIKSTWDKLKRYE